MRESNPLQRDHSLYHGRDEASTLTAAICRSFRAGMELAYAEHKGESNPPTCS